MGIVKIYTLWEWFDLEYLLSLYFGILFFKYFFMNHSEIILLGGNKSLDSF